MRLELWECGGVRVLDDAYNANADSMVAALQTLQELPCKGRRVAVLGDMAELGAHSEAAHEEVGRRAAELGVGQLFAVGKMAPVMARAARDAGLNRVFEFADVETAAAAVKSFVKTGDLVLLKASRATRLERIARTVASRRSRQKKLNVLLLEPILAGVVGGDRVGGPSLRPAALPLHHLSQRRGGDDRAGPELVAGAEGDRLAEAIEIRPGVRGQGGSGGGMAARLLSKKGTPTMGGILIVVVLNLTTLLWAQWNTLVQLTLLSVVVLTGLGFYDDYAKITQQSSGGARSCVKLWVQAALALFIGLYLWQLPSTRKLITEIMVPFYKYPVLTGAGLVGLVLTVLTIVGSSNAVNLTDGLDGLAIGCTLIVSFVFLVLTYLAGTGRLPPICRFPTWSGRAN